MSAAFGESEQALADLLATLEAASLQGLREVWRERIGSPPPIRSPELLRLSLMWRLQEGRFGGLDADLRGRLRGRGSSDEAKLTSGVKLVREWEGVRHEVTVTETGFAYAGKSWASLSGIARAITGVRWNGPRFFGLRIQQAKAA